MEVRVEEEDSNSMGACMGGVGGSQAEQSAIAHIHHQIG